MVAQTPESPFRTPLPGWSGRHAMPLRLTRWTRWTLKNPTVLIQESHRQRRRIGVQPLAVIRSKNRYDAPSMVSIALVLDSTEKATATLPGAVSTICA